jgi:hypothetical protein
MWQWPDRNPLGTDSIKWAGAPCAVLALNEAFRPG